MFLKAKDIFDAFGSAVYFNNHVSGNVFKAKNISDAWGVPTAGPIMKVVMFF